MSRRTYKPEIIRRAFKDYRKNKRLKDRRALYEQHQHWF